MIGFVGQILSGSGRAAGYDAKKREAWRQASWARLRGKMARQEGETEAWNIFETEKKNKELRGMQQRQARRQQTEDVSRARNVEAGRGTTVEAGNTASDEVRRSWDQQIENMATSSSVSMANAMQRALDASNKGRNAEAWANVEAMGYEAQAEQYRRMAKDTRQNLWMNGIVSGLSAVAGGVNGYFAGSAAGKSGGELVKSVLSGAGNYGDTAWDLGSSFNPYLTGLQVDPRGSASNLLGIISGENGLGMNYTAWRQRRRAGQPTAGNITDTGSGPSTMDEYAIPMSDTDLPYWLS